MFSYTCTTISCTYICNIPLSVCYSQSNTRERRNRIRLRARKRRSKPATDASPDQWFLTISALACRYSSFTETNYTDLCCHCSLLLRVWTATGTYVHALMCERGDLQQRDCFSHLLFGLALLCLYGYISACMYMRTTSRSEWILRACCTGVDIVMFMLDFCPGWRNGQRLGPVAEERNAQLSSLWLYFKFLRFAKRKQVQYSVGIYWFWSLKISGVHFDYISLK